MEEKLAISDRSLASPETSETERYGCVGVVKGMALFAYYNGSILSMFYLWEEI